MASLRVVRPAPVSQQELESLIGIQNQIRHLRRMYDRQCADLLDRLLAGVDVEPGIHQAEAHTEESGPRRVTRLIIY